MVRRFASLVKRVACRQMGPDPMMSAGGRAAATASGACCCDVHKCGHVGSTAMVVVEEDRCAAVANCGDSRAALCRGEDDAPPVALSADHKPDRPDELQRIETEGERVIFWEGARVLGMLVMSVREAFALIAEGKQTVRIEYVGGFSCFAVHDDVLYSVSIDNRVM